ncbi:MAG TPA: hypothetical protein VK254_02555 [Candidatus Bathyarchaeia archaeon]|nr:hypothetical protein [Candidatus Bathyarchaeia archaeon]
MAQSNYQEPIEQKDTELGKKFSEVNIDAEKEEAIPVPEVTKESQVEASMESSADDEAMADKPEEKVSEKIETARKTITSQQAAPAGNIASDAQTVSDIQEYEKKVEKLVEIAVHQGPEHAIRVAQHMDKGKDSGQADNYTLDEIHDRLMEDGLRAQLMQKGLLVEL